MVTQLVRDRELNSPAFARDLGVFLTQPAEVLLAVAEVGNRSEGFSGQDQARELHDRYEVPISTGLNCLRVAGYLYDRMSESALDVDSAVEELKAIAGALPQQVVVDDQRAEAIAAVLAVKPDYEITLAIREAFANAPHFISVHGSWAVKPVRDRNGEPFNLATMALSLYWHDGAGNSHEVVVNMSRDAWQEFMATIQEIDDDFSDIEELL